MSYGSDIAPGDRGGQGGGRGTEPARSKLFSLEYFTTDRKGRSSFDGIRNTVNVIMSAFPIGGEEGQIRRRLEQDGFVIIRGVVEEGECDRFSHDSVLPAITELTKFRENDPETFKGVEGTMVHNKGKDPIQSSDARWPALMESPRLNAILDNLHGGGSRWEWLHDDNVGWIHIRFPNVSEEQSREQSRLPKVGDFGWHVDGGHFDFHKFDSPEQSVILLPMVRDVSELGGATKIIRGSHKEVGEYLAYKGREGVHRRMLNEQIKMYFVHSILNKEPERLCAASAKKGDVLLMHPFLIHTAAVNAKGFPWRLTFNMGTKWKLCPPARSPLQRPIVSEESHCLHYGEFVFLHFRCGGGALGIMEDGSNLVNAKKIEKEGAEGCDILLRHRFQIHSRSSKQIGERVKVGDKIYVKHRTEEGTGRLCFFGPPHEGPLLMKDGESCGSTFKVCSYSAEGSNIFFGSSSFFLQTQEDDYVGRGEMFLDTEGLNGGLVRARWKDMGDWQEMYATK